MSLQAAIKQLEEQNKDGCYDGAIQELKLAIPQTIKIQEYCPSRCPNCNSELSEHHGDGYYSIRKKHQWCPQCKQTLSWKYASELY